MNVTSNLREKINNEVYTWYVNRDRYLLKLLCNRGKFRKEILENERTELRREIEEIWKDSKKYTTWDIITRLYDVRIKRYKKKQ